MREGTFPNMEYKAEVLFNFTVSRNFFVEGKISIIEAEKLLKEQIDNWAFKYTRNSLLAYFSSEIKEISGSPKEFASGEESTK